MEVVTHSQQTRFIGSSDTGNQLSMQRFIARVEGPNSMTLMENFVRMAEQASGRGLPGKRPPPLHPYGRDTQRAHGQSCPSDTGNQLLSISFQCVSLKSSLLQFYLIIVVFKYKKNIITHKEDILISSISYGNLLPEGRGPIDRARREVWVGRFPMLFPSLLADDPRFGSFQTLERFSKNLG
jgi:hypothetical protein